MGNLYKVLDSNLIATNIPKKNKRIKFSSNPSFIDQFIIREKLNPKSPITRERTSSLIYSWPMDVLAAHIITLFIAFQ